jgi:hypothetical protein
MAMFDDLRFYVRARILDFGRGAAHRFDQPCLRVNVGINIASEFDQRLDDSDKLYAGLRSPLNLGELFDCRFGRSALFKSDRDSHLLVLVG